MQNWMELATAIVTAAGIIAGALKLLARELRKAIDRHGAKIEANTQAIDRNTEAVDTLTSYPKRIGAKVAPLLLLLVLPLALAGCTSTDPLVIRALERNREVWEEDRRPDLDPELIESRQAEFDAQLRYAKAPK